MAIREREYHKYLASEMVFELVKQAQRKSLRALNVEDDIIESEYWRGYWEGADKAFEIMLQMFSKELEAHRSELEAVSNERDELVNRYRWRYWRS